MRIAPETDHAVKCGPGGYRTGLDEPFAAGQKLAA